MHVLKKKRFISTSFLIFAPNYLWIDIELNSRKFSYELSWGTVIIQFTITQNKWKVDLNRAMSLTPKLNLSRTFWTLYSSAHSTQNLSLLLYKTTTPILSSLSQSKNLLTFFPLLCSSGTSGGHWVGQTTSLSDFIYRGKKSIWTNDSSQNSTPQKRSRKLLSLRNCWFSHKIILHLKVTQGDKKVGLTRLERNYDLQSGHTTPFTIHNYVSTQRKLKWWLMLFSIEPSIKLKSIFQVLVLWWQAKNKNCSFLFSFGFAFGSLEKNAV